MILTMRCKIVLLIVATATMHFLWSCDHSDSGEHHAEAAMPQLDNGKRWVADAPTRAGFAKLRADLPSATPAGQPIQQYNVRAQKLTEDINAVFAACKMTGPGHVELHKYIGILLQDLEPMRGKDQHRAQQAQEKLSRDIDLFRTYFE